MNIFKKKIRKYIGILHFTVHRRYCIIYKLKTWATLTHASLSAPSFPTAFAHCVSVSHFGTSPNISKFFIIIIFGMVICDVTVLIVLERHKLHSHEMVDLIYTVRVLTDQLTGRSPISLLFWPLYFLKHNIKISTTNNLTMAYKCSSERRVPHLSL